MSQASDGPEMPQRNRNNISNPLRDLPYRFNLPDHYDSFLSDTSIPPWNHDMMVSHPLI